MMQIKHRRPDGSFVADLGGLPYHVAKGDLLWIAAEAMAKGKRLPPEPLPAPIIVPPAPLAWLDRLPAKRQAAMLDALDATPEGRLVQKRILATPTLDLAGDDVAACLALLDGVLSADEIALLRGPS